jgi:hypothetical protein
MAVSAKSHDDSDELGGFETAVKRRKLSTPVVQSPLAARSSSSSASRQATAPQTHHGHPVAGRGRVYASQMLPGPTPSRVVNRSVQANGTMANKPPSVHYMNGALKTNGATSPLVDHVIEPAPRAPQIDRMPSYGSTPSLPNLKRVTLDPPLTAPIVTNRSLITQTEGTAKPSAKTSPSLGSRLSSGSAVQSKTGGDIPLRAEGDLVAMNMVQQKGRSYSSGAVAPTRGDDKDMVMLGLPLLSERMGASIVATQNSSNPPSHIMLSQGSKPSTKSTVQPFSEEEEHLLIFLKEVKKMPWKSLTAEFAKDYSGRPYHTLQSRYSTKTNKRDRSRDPLTLKLPPRWTMEAVIDWSSVHAENPRPRQRSELTELRPHTVPMNQRAHRAPNLESVAPGPIAYRQASELDNSSGQDSGPRKERVRRAPPVNYTWPRHRGIDPGYEAKEGEERRERVWDGLIDADEPMRLETPEEVIDIPTIALPIENEPMAVDFNADDATLALAASRRSNKNQMLPYLTAAQRHAIRKPPDDWSWDQLPSREYQGSTLHVDFSASEIAVVEEAAAKIVESTRQSRHSTRRRHLRVTLKDLSESKILQLAHNVRRRLLCRDRNSVKSFLLDAQAGKISNVPKVQRLAAARTKKESSSRRKDSTADILRQRELGLQSTRGWKAPSRPLTYQVRSKLIDTLGLSSCWTGASGDIHTVAWSQDGECFAAGAVAVTDPDSMQYNRHNNLLYGNLLGGTIHELGEHSKDREKTEGGANSTHAMFVSQDPKLYTTVTSVAFSPSGKVMYSSGYDNSICVWHLGSVSSQPELGAKMRHKHEVEMMVVNDNYDGTLATAAKTSGSAVKLITLDEDDPSTFKRVNYHSEKAALRVDLRILPQALQFEPQHGRLLLAGFGANVRNDNCFDSTGDLCLWDIETATQLNVHGSNRNVLDVAFNPNRRYMPAFAAGCVAASNVNRGTRSVIRLYDEQSSDKYTCPLEIECKALDMNDVVWW